MDNKAHTEPQTLKSVETIHTSLLGMTLICVVLLYGMLLPLFGINPVSSPWVAGIVTTTVIVGLAYLYTLNFKAHKLVQEQARLTDVLINSLGQGFLTFDNKGVCGEIYSQACLVLLDTKQVAGVDVMSILRIEPDKRDEFMEWLGILFQPDHALSFDDAVRFLPDIIPRQDDRAVLITYRPVRDKENRLMRIVLIATDHTEEKEAQKRADAERQFAAMICAIFAERQNFMLTMGEMKELIDSLSDINLSLFEPEFYRQVHTLKGAVLHFKMDKLGEAMHELENALRAAKEMDPASAREVIGHSRGEVQLEYGRIQNVLRDVLGENDEYNQGLIEVDEEAIYEFGKLLKNQNVSPDILYAYQSTVLAIPLFTLLKTLDRQMLALADKLEKRIRPIVFQGENVRLPARPLQHLVMTLTHVAHNIIDHGIETPIARMAKGKDATGQITVIVRRLTDDYGMRWVEIVIADDGAGIDPNKVRAKLTTADPDGSWRFEDDDTVIQHLLTQSLSTRDEVSMLSGRGEGMNALYQEVLRLGGRCRIHSQMHKGTQLIIHLPEKLQDSL